MAIAVGAALLLPVSIASNEVLLLYPNSYYVKWLNSSLIQGKLVWCFSPFGKQWMDRIANECCVIIYYLPSLIVYCRSLESCFSILQSVIVCVPAVCLPLYWIDGLLWPQEGSDSSCLWDLYSIQPFGFCRFGLDLCTVSRNGSWKNWISLIAK